MTHDLNLTEDQRQVLGAAQNLLRASYPPEHLRDPAATVATAPLAEFGAFALALPEDQGGAGFSVVEEALLHAELGRHLVPPFAIAAPLAVRLAVENGDIGLAAAIVSGEMTVCAGVETTDGLLLFEPKGAACGVIRSPRGVYSHPLAGVELADEVAMGHGRPVARVVGGLAANNAPPSDGITEIAALLTSAQLLGVARGARDLAVAYAGMREQFGRPIGSFQAIKHHCANMTLGVEMLSAQLDMASIALRDGWDDAGFQVTALSRLAPQIALRNARLGIQIHGGIGFSAEADAQLYLKQAHLLRAFLPGADLLSLPAPLAPFGKER